MTGPETTDALALDACAATLLDRRASGAAQQAACAALHAACLARLPTLEEGATALACGAALAPAAAANCLLDHARTACLLRALDARIAERRAQADEVRVLYAGCGPLAPLALLLARRWRGRGVRFELVDIHPQSIAAARRLFALAEVAGMLAGTTCADAATLRLAAGAPRPQLLVAEVMQRALAREPQVAVVANLLPQCAADAVLVPESIQVAAALGDAAAYAADPAMLRTRRIAPLLTLARDSVPAIAAALRGGAAALPEVQCVVPPGSHGARDLVLTTQLVAGPGEVLDEAASGLTMPWFAHALGRLHGGETLGFAYRLGADPGFAIRRID
jgi:hypothetical protein